MVKMNDIGNFQANVGIVSSDIGVIISYITAGFLIIFSIGMAIAAFVPMKPLDCENPIPECNVSGFENQCEQEKKRCNTKTTNHNFLWFLLLIPLAIIIVLFSKWWNHYVHTNKTAAQIGGTMAEIDMVKSLFKR